MFERIVAALESIAASLQKLSNPAVTFSAAVGAAAAAAPAAESPAPTEQPKRGPGRPRRAAPAAAPAPAPTSAPAATNIVPFVQPTTTPAPAAPVPTAAPAPAQGPTIASVRAALVAYGEKNGNDRAKEVMQNVGNAPTLSAVDPSKYQAILDELFRVSTPAVAATPPAVDPFNS